MSLRTGRWVEFWIIYENRTGRIIVSQCITLERIFVELSLFARNNETKTWTISKIGAPPPTHTHTHPHTHTHTHTCCHPAGSGRCRLYGSRKRLFTDVDFCRTRARKIIFYGQNRQRSPFTYRAPFFYLFLRYFRRLIVTNDQSSDEM